MFVCALISILLSAHTGGMKIAWLVFAFVAPFLGCLLWFVVGRGDAYRRRAV
ncbi:PLD nuclease N-terminal domain-containing protein [Saccharopolyspora hattusasensis]|uniref:PLD nuclease N-terminal domain-containing protein n=1 Tax=Saccharopolyspora hattusasensis TaxID=1128679 RepID=UPI003D957D86